VPAALSSALTACSSLTPVNDPVYFRIEDIEARLIRIERVLENESLVALAGEINSLRSETRTLLGEVETLRFQLENQSEGQRTNYLVLDERLREIELAQERMSSMPVGPTGAPVAAMTDQQAYDAAFAMIERGDYAAGQQAMQQFLVTYPASSLRSNAQYWLGEAIYAQAEFASAMAEFQKVLRDYPQSNKVPDALVKIGLSQYGLGNLDAAQQTLMQVLREYADTPAAATAEQRLTRISEEGR
jgi:tol-pal system protein YbgF